MQLHVVVLEGGNGTQVSDVRVLWAPLFILIVNPQNIPAKYQVLFFPLYEGCSESSDSGVISQ